MSVALLLAGCSSAAPSGDRAVSSSTDPGPAEQAFLAKHDLTDKDVRQIIDHLDRLGGPDRPSDLMASVRTDQLLLSDGQDELGLRMPADASYLSVAPYIKDTHECFNHSLTTCQGELRGEKVKVTIVNDETRAVLVDEEVTTFENGFVGFWLPRDVKGTVRVAAAGKAGQVEFSTGAESPTCMTTLRLA
jgi:hypothetical protein